MVSLDVFEREIGVDLADVTGADIESWAVGRGPHSQADLAISGIELAKKAVIAGEMQLGAFMGIAADLGKMGVDAANFLSTGGGHQGPLVDALYSRLTKFVETDTADGLGRGSFRDVNFTRAFTRREIATLPESVLPTREDVDSGLIPLDLFPTGLKMRPEPKPDEPEIIETPLPPDQSLIQTPTPLPVTPGQGTITPDPSIQLPADAGIGSLIGDPHRLEATLTPYQKQIEDFGRRQEEQLRQMFQVKEQQQKSRLTDLSSFLAGEEERRYQQAIPGIQEGLNTQGLLRSSALGTEMARKRSDLEADTQAALMGQGLEDRQSQIDATGQILEPRLGAQQAGFERYFSLQDLQREQSIARELAALGIQYTPSGDGMSAGEGIFSGALSGAATGGSVGGGWGALIGGAVGAVGGGVAANNDDGGK